MATSCERIGERSGVPCLMLMRLNQFHEIHGRVTPHGIHPRFGLSSRREKQNAQPKWRQYMPLISVIVTLIVVGVLLWLVNTYIPMDGKIKRSSTPSW